MTGLEVAAFFAIRAIYKAVVSSQSSNSTSNVATAHVPEKVITFVGATGAGKSSALNGLLGYPAFDVGAEHGTTKSIIDKSYTQGYQVRDTPGLLDDVNYSDLVWESIKTSELVIYTASGQLLRPEEEMVKRIHDGQREWDTQSNTVGRRKLALYVSHQDIRDTRMPSKSRASVELAIREQASGLISHDKIAFGSVAYGSYAAQVDQLRNLIQQHIAGS